MQHVLTMALGPVQEFLAAARRTRDLWFGSWLLSELARAAGLAIRERSGADGLIFPAPDRLDDLDATFTNKVLAVVEDPRSVAKAAIAMVYERLQSLRDDAFRGLVGKEPLFLEGPAFAQISDLIELQWASAEMASPTDYKSARDLAEALLAARKNTRLWDPVTWGAPVPKSSIDGQRESVLHEDLFDPKKGWSPRQLFETFRVGDRERLCGVGLLKRRGVRRSARFDHHFLSAGHLAAWPLLERIEGLARRSPERRDALATAWARFESALREAGVRLEEQRAYTPGQGHPILGAYDGSLLFESRLGDLFSEVDKAAEKRRRAEPLRTKLGAFLSLTEVSAPLPYFAVLVADGDRMGEAIDQITEVERHGQLSDALSGFTRRAREIVERDHRGELVFAGGDDVLAFVPLHHAVSCARALASDFRERLAGFKAGLTGDAPTLSVGIGIAHFMEPLSRALELARGAERAAKAVSGKNALAVHLDKRSGPGLEVRGRWGDLDPVLDAFVELHVEDRIPDGMAYELRELARLTEKAEADALPTLEHLVSREAERILRRKQPGHGEEERLSPETLARLRQSYERLSQEIGGQALAAFADRLILARLLAEARMQAEPPPAKDVAGEVAA